MTDTLVDFTHIDTPDASKGDIIEIYDDVETVVTDSQTLVMRIRDVPTLLPHDKAFDRGEYDKLFDDETTSRYRAYRIKRQDPITCENMKEKNSFKYKYIWNCITGEKIGIDPHGPLCLSPITILRTILSQILIGLWTEIENCIPMYGENVGLGKTFAIPGRGAQPEKYIFRLPIQDCYLYRDSDKFGKSVHTMGPELTDDDLREIDRLIQEYGGDDPYIISLPETALDMLELRKLYDAVLNSEPTQDIESLPECIRIKYLQTLAVGNIDIDHNAFINRIAVEEIKKRIGFRSKEYY